MTKVYNHPSVRLTEEVLNNQMLTIFKALRLPDTVRDWFLRMILLWSHSEQKIARELTEGVQKQLTSLRSQKDRLLNLHLLGELNDAEFSAKHTDLRDCIAQYTERLESADRSRDEHADIAVKAFELSQSLYSGWVGADYAVKRQILEIMCLNFWLDGVSLVPVWRKPFDVLVGGLSVSLDRGDRTPVELFCVFCSEIKVLGGLLEKIS